MITGDKYFLWEHHDPPPAAHTSASVGTGNRRVRWKDRHALQNLLLVPVNRNQFSRLLDRCSAHHCADVNTHGWVRVAKKLRCVHQKTGLASRPMAPTESHYVEKDGYLSELVHQQELAFRETDGHIATEFGSEAEWMRCITEEFPKFIPFLMRRGVRFRGRVLEIGAGACWFSAELSKLPEVAEIIATDFSPKLLKELAPRVFEARQANAGKITRMPGDFHKLDLADNSFDFAVCSAVLHHAVDMVEVLRELKRILKPGGQFIAIREPVWPLIQFKSRSKTQKALIDRKSTRLNSSH